MCTVTILPTLDNSIVITMNRDEDKRKEELEPALHNFGQVKILAPVDTESGGSWIGVNSSNIAACLLNRYDQPFNNSLKSRGNIVFETLENINFADASTFVKTKLSAMDYNPFTLLVISVNELIIATWDGKKLDIEKQSTHKPFMISSSSWEQEKVVSWRKDIFELWVSKGMAFDNGIPSFHLLQPENWQEWSPLVERVSVNTRSVTQINLGADYNSINYWGNPYLSNHKLVA